MRTVGDPKLASTTAPVADAEPRSVPTPVRVTPETELTLLLDVGSAWTKAALVGRAGGRWRVVSGAAQPSSWGEAVLLEDLVTSLGPHADARLQKRLPLLVREAPRITCRSPRRRGRLAVVADHGTALDAATTLATRNGWTVEAAVAGDDRLEPAERFDRLRAIEVDAWLAVPAVDGGSGPVWGVMAAARGAAAATRVLVVGPVDEPAALATLFGSKAEWIAERVDGGLADALIAQLTTLNGLDAARTATPVAFGRAIDALAAGLGLAVLGVDLGASWLAWRRSGDDQRTAMLAAAAERPLPEGSRAAAEILPADADAFTTSDAMAGLAARGSGLPATSVEEAIAQAIGIDRLASARRLLGGCPSVDLIVGGGRLLSAGPHPADATLILLDGLRPPGVTQLAIDPWGICGPLGALADEDVDEGLETLRDDLLVPLGSAVRAEGGHPGQVAFRARLHRPGWPDPAAVEVRTGSMAVLPLERGGSGELEIELERGVSIGAPVRDHRLRVAVTGGAVGVVLDARGDPIQLPTRPGDARSQIQAWRDALRREAPSSGAG
jgi:hypothetical protein